MKLYRIDVMMCGTAYIKAENEEEAAKAVQELHLSGIDGGFGDVPICGDPFEDPDLPDVSLSPAMTVYGAWIGSEPPKQEVSAIVEHLDEVHDYDEEEVEEDA